jgi:branched-chain amino acid transport system substrate-binding protein
VLAAGVAASGAGAGPEGHAKITGTSLTIYSSLPEHGPARWQTRAIENGIRMALAERDRKVGGYTVRYKPLDDSRHSIADVGAGARNARRAASNKRTIGYIGEYNSGISMVTIPILNKKGIAQISPTNTYVGLTTAAPGHAPGEPDKYYPTGRRTYARLMPNDTVQSRALALATQQDGCASVHVLRSGTLYSNGLSRSIADSAAQIGLPIAATTRYNPRARRYGKVASKVAAPCVIQTGEIEASGARVLKAVAAAHGEARLYGADGVCLNVSANASYGIPPSVAPRYRCTIASLDPEAYGPEGREFFANYSARYHQRNPDPYAVYGYEAMSLMLDSVQRAIDADGDLTRRKVVDALFATRDRRGAVGTYSIDANGDTTLTDYGLYRIDGKRLTFDRVIR